MYVPIMLAVRYGLRRGEILGIKPKIDIDYLTGTLHIQRTLTVENGKKQITSCKTNNSDRRLLLALARFHMALGDRHMPHSHVFHQNLKSLRTSAIDHRAAAFLPNRFVLHYVTYITLIILCLLYYVNVVM